MQNASMTFVQTGPDVLRTGLWRDLDAKNNNIRNLGPAIGVDDAVPLGQVTGLLQVEIDDRTLVDQGLTLAINNETTARQNSDTALGQALANEAVARAASALPVGGAIGQVLVKTAGTNYAAQWEFRAGLGDMVRSANLSDLPDKAAARTSLELGTAALSAAADFATAAQGTLASNATQKAQNGADFADRQATFANLMARTVTLAAATDLNTVTADGEWYLNGSGYPNSPTSLFARLTVRPLYAGAPQKEQVIRPMAGAAQDSPEHTREWRRSFVVGSPTVFSAWREVAYSDIVPSRFKRDMGGQLDLGTTAWFMAHTGPEHAIGGGRWFARDSATDPRPNVLGFQVDSDIAGYGGLDSVSVYIDTVGPALVATLAGTYTSTTWVPSSALSASVLARMYVGQYIRTATSGHFGKITAFSATSVTVSGWYATGNAAAGQVPGAGQSAQIGVVTGVWGMNLNAFLGPNSHANNAIAAEIGIGNYKSDYVLGSGGAQANGINVANIGTKNTHFGMLVNRQSVAAGTIARAYLASDTSFSGFEVLNWSGLSVQPTYGFLYNLGGSGNAFTVGTGGGIKFNVNGNGAIFANDNMGIGFAPQTDNRLFIRGYGSTGATNLINAQGSDGNTKFSVRDDGVTFIGAFTVANLPTAPAGSLAFASNGRSGGQAAGAGTGVLVFRNTASTWIACDSGVAVAA